MEGRDKEEAPRPGGKAVSLRRSARVASNHSAASSVSLRVEGGGGASEGEGGEGEISLFEVRFSDFSTGHFVHSRRTLAGAES